MREGIFRNKRHLKDYNIISKGKKIIIFGTARPTVNFSYTSVLLYKLGEIGIGRNKWLFAEVYSGQRRRAFELITAYSEYKTWTNKNVLPFSLN